MAGRLACESLTEEEIAEIEALHHKMYACYLHRDVPGYFQANQMIHGKLVEASRNTALCLTYASYTDRMRRIRFSANLAHNQDRWGAAMREHEAILDALRRRASLELSDILFQHLRHKRAAAIAHLTGQRTAQS